MALTEAVTAEPGGSINICTTLCASPSIRFEIFHWKFDTLMMPAKRDYQSQYDLSFGNPKWWKSVIVIHPIVVLSRYHSLNQIGGMTNSFIIIWVPLKLKFRDWFLFTQCVTATSASSVKHDSELYLLLLICRVLTLWFYPSCRSHPLCGTLWLRGSDRRRPQLQERRKVPDYQQHVSHYCCLSDCLHLGGMQVAHFITVLNGIVLLGGEPTGHPISADVKVAACIRLGPKISLLYFSLRTYIIIKNIFSCFQKMWQPLNFFCKYKRCLNANKIVKKARIYSIFGCNI